jgi:hypothetical protein
MYRSHAQLHLQGKHCARSQLWAVNTCLASKGLAGDGEISDRKMLPILPYDLSTLLA